MAKYVFSVPCTVYIKGIWSVATVLCPKSEKLVFFSFSCSQDSLDVLRKGSVDKNEAVADTCRLAVSRYVHGIFCGSALNTNGVSICVMTRIFQGKIAQKIWDFFIKILNFSGNFNPKKYGSWRRLRHHSTHLFMLHWFGGHFLAETTWIPTFELTMCTNCTRSEIQVYTVGYRKSLPQ